MQSTNFSTELFNSFNPFKLKIKIGTPTILLRNLNTPRLCNRARLQVTVMRDNVIEATFLTCW